MPQSNPRTSHTAYRSVQPQVMRPSRPGRSVADKRRRPAPDRVSSVSVGDVQKKSRSQRVQATYRKFIIRIAVILGIVGVLALGYFVLYNSNAFTIEKVTVSGVEHLTASEMTELAAVPSNATLLRVDAGGIRERLLSNAWVEDASVDRVLPDTVNLSIRERTISAVVDLTVNNGQSTERWAIAEDGMWLMSIPDKNSEQAATVPDKVYEDADNVLQISDVPYGSKPETGTYCSDDNVNNALSIISGMTTELADQVKRVSASSADNTTLTLENGVQIAFGSAEDIRDKERVCLNLMKEHPDEISYINVRVVDRPTWRSI